MKKMYASIAPERVVLMGAKKQLNYNIHEVEEDEIKALWEKNENSEMSYEVFAEQHKYGYYSLVVGGARWNYNDIVSEIVRAKYPEQDMEAITNNLTAQVSDFLSILVTDGIIKATKHLVDNIDAEKTARFKEMQEWRAKAKVWAREVFNK